MRRSSTRGSASPSACVSDRQRRTPKIVSGAEAHVCNVKSSIRPHARDLALIVLASSAIFRLDPVTDTHARAAPVAAGVALPLLGATAGVLGFDVLLEDARLLFAVVICVWTNRETRRVEA